MRMRGSNPKLVGVVATLGAILVACSSGSASQEATSEGTSSPDDATTTQEGDGEEPDAPEPEQAFPHSQVNFIVPFGPGGGTDTIARTFGDYFAQELGAQVVFENVSGAGGTVGLTQLLDSPADGSVIGLTSDGAMQLAPLLNSDLRWEDHNEFTVLAKLPSNPMMMVAHPDAPYETLSDVIEAARNSPGEIGIAHAGPQTSDVVAGLALSEATGVEFNHVPLDGGAGARTEVIAGRLDLAIASPAAYLGSLEAGELKPIVIFWSERDPELPEVPTAEEQGYDLVYSGDYYLVGPPGMPSDVAGQITEAAMASGANEEYQAAARQQGTVPDLRGTEEALEILEENARLMRQLQPRFEQLIAQ